MGFVPNWGLLCVTRVLLGIFEAGFFPALAFIITTWYKRHEVQKRLAGFYLISIFLGGFSSILAYGITFMKGLGGLNGWQWIFVIEGLLTVALGGLTWMFVPDFPDKNRFLGPEETKMILDRIEADRNDAVPDPVTGRKIVKHLSDPYLWSFALMFLASTMPAYAIGFFITILLSAMGFSLTESLLLSAPPYVAAAMSCFFFAWLADKTRKRAVWLAVQNVMTMIGLMITGYGKLNGVRYFGLFLVNMGASGCVPGVLAYNANNIVSQSKRAVSSAAIIAFGGIGGIFATLVYRQEDFPLYIPGIWATMACQFMMLILLAINSFVFYRRNREAREGKRVNEDSARPMAQPPCSSGVRAQANSFSYHNHIGPAKMQGSASNFNSGNNWGTISQVNNVTLQGDASLRAVESSSDDRADAPKCHPETRKAVQENIFSWISRGADHGHPERILWLTGPAGAGKTAIMGTISDVLEERGELVASFYFASYTNSIERKSKRRFEVLSTIQEDPAVFKASLKGQMEALVLRPFRHAALNHSPGSLDSPLVIVIDGVDECGEDRYDDPRRSREVDQLGVLSVLLQAIRDSSFPCRIIIASRPETWIRRFFATSGSGHVTEIFLDEKFNPDQDIELFLNSKFAGLHHRYALPSTWPAEQDIRTLVENASGQFIYAATVVRFVETPSRPPAEQLNIVLNIEPHEGSSSPFGPLDDLYITILKSSPSPSDTVLWLRALQLLRSGISVEPTPDETPDSQNELQDPTRIDNIFPPMNRGYGLQPAAWTVDRLFESSAGQAQILLGLPSLLYLDEKLGSRRAPGCDTL
ncbi:hypothetical protein NMY22_g13355 [Coprinellus aureogranulatus]|nr:hypothetical protein NMY22_g13355 [Coprinellus aureogranulatus]